MNMKKTSCFYLTFCLFLLIGVFLHAQQNRPGLYMGDAFQGAFDLYDSFDWITLNAQSGGSYTIVLGSDQSVNNVKLNYGNKQITVFLKSSAGERIVRFDRSNPTGPLFTVNTGATFILEEGVTLSGKGVDARSASNLVCVIGEGKFIMNGGILRDNKLIPPQSRIEHQRTPHTVTHP